MVTVVTRVWHHSLHVTAAGLRRGIVCFIWIAWYNWCCSRDSMCRDCVISGCFVAYHKAQIDRLSADISEMAISPSNPNVWFVHLKTFQCRDVDCELWICDMFVKPDIHSNSALIVLTVSVFLENLTIAVSKILGLFVQLFRTSYEQADDENWTDISAL